MSYELVLLCISLFTWGLGEGMFFIFQPIYLQQLGADTMTTAGVFSAFGVAMMIAHVPAGYLADRVGRKPLLVAAWTCGLSATWVMAAARSLPLFVAGMLLYGLTAFVSSPLNSYITAASGRMSPGRAMTLVSACFNFGAVLGPLVGGWLGDHLTLRVIYVVAGCLFAVSTAMLIFLRNQPRETDDPTDPPPNLWANRRFFGFLGIIFVVMFTMYLPQPLTPRFLENERGMSLSAVGMIGSVGNLGNALMNLLLGQLPAWIGFLLTQVSTALFALLMWLGTGQFWFALGYFLLGGYRSARPLYFAQIRILIHRAQMGLAYGVAETVNATTIILAPLLAGVLYNRDPVLVFPVSIGLILLALAVTAVFAPKEAARDPQAAISLPPDFPLAE
ncbi:MAG: MFS transporter [Anaerolineales bacterium]|nr:MFS transporter [Anaerolineales bacterium]